MVLFGLLGRRLTVFLTFHKERGNKFITTKASLREFRLAIPPLRASLPCMKSYLIMTVLGSDRPGLVSSLADAVAAHGGNWLESRMARLAGQFAGIARIEVPSEAVDGLLSSLRDPGIEGLTVQAVREKVETPLALRTLAVDVVGNDRPGIVKELSAAIVKAGGNVEELTTGLESAPMSGHPMFRAHGVISIGAEVDASSLTAAIENLGGDLTVDVTV
jgi:glycine cleavage system regulatory protein